MVLWGDPCPWWGGKCRSIIRRTCATIYSFPARAPASSRTCRLRKRATVHVRSTSLLSCSSWQWPSVTRNPIPLPTVTKLSTLIIYRMYCYRMSVMYTLSFKILYIPRCSYKNNYIKVWVCRKRCTTVSNYSTTCCMNCCCCLITEPDLLWACSLAEDAPSHMQHQVQSDYTIFLNKLK